MARSEFILSPPPPTTHRRVFLDWVSTENHSWGGCSVGLLPKLPLNERVVIHLSFVKVFLTTIDSKGWRTTNEKQEKEKRTRTKKNNFKPKGTKNYQKSTVIRNAHTYLSSVPHQKFVFLEQFFYLFCILKGLFLENHNPWVFKDPQHIWEYYAFFLEKPQPLGFEKPSAYLWGLYGFPIHFAHVHPNSPIFIIFRREEKIFSRQQTVYIFLPKSPRQPGQDIIIIPFFFLD